MSDLTWVKRTTVVREGEPVKDTMERDPGWHLLHVTGGLHGPIEYVFGWGDPPEQFRALGGYSALGGGPA